MTPCCKFSLDAALLRQAVVGTLRLGIYFNLTEWVKMNQNHGKNLNFQQRALTSALAGGTASFLGNPFDLALVRMQADSTLLIAERRNYKNAVNAIMRIATDEGITALWKGAVPTVAEAIISAISILATYDTAKEFY